MGNASTIGRNIAKKLDAMGMTQLDLAHKTGLTQASVSRIISGVTQARFANLKVIAEALDCTVEELQGVKFSLSDAAEILLLFENQSPLMQRVLLALLHKDPSLVVEDCPEAARLVQLLSTAP